jgi:hypothetical protein
MTESQRAAAAAELANIKNGTNQHALGSANGPTLISEQKAAERLKGWRAIGPSRQGISGVLTFPAITAAGR